MKEDKFIEENKVCKDLHSKREIGLLECFGMLILGIVGYLLVSTFADKFNLPKTLVNITSLLCFGLTILSSIGVAKIIWKGTEKDFRPSL